MGRSPGKLKAAARWLVLPADAAAGTPQDDEAEAALARLGVPAEQIRQGREVRGGREDLADLAPALWPWHRDAAVLFGAMRRQWRVAVVARRLLYLGLDFNALGEVRRHLRIKASPALIEQLRTMEAAGAEALNNLQG